MKPIHGAVPFVLLSFASGASRADHLSDQVNALADAFVSSVSGQFQVSPYAYQFMDMSTCFEGTNKCAGANPASPYAFPQQIPTFKIAAQMGNSDAQVLTHKP